MELKFACGFHIFLALQRQISVKELAQRLLYICMCWQFWKTWFWIVCFFVRLLRKGKNEISFKVSYNCTVCRFKITEPHLADRLFNLI